MITELNKKIIELRELGLKHREIAKIVDKPTDNVRQRLSRMGFSRGKHGTQIIKEDKKQCSKCKEWLSLNSFYKDLKSSSKLRANCKTCVSIDKRRRLYKWAQEIFGQHLKCSICGYDKNFAVLDFHHIKPETKLFNISNWEGRRKEDMISEFKKCKILCANCHRDFHTPNMRLLTLELLSEKSIAPGTPSL